MKRFAPPAAGPRSLWLGLVLTFSALPFSSVAPAATGVVPGVANLIASPEPGWPQFRGPKRDGLSAERGLLQAWPEGGPQQLWSTTGAGRGYSSPIIADGRFFITGDFGEDLYVLAYDLTGKLLWRTRNGAAWLNQHQGSRASVTYSDGRIFHQNAHGRVACFDAASGKELWALGLLERFRGENIRWGLSECLAVDERAVYATAGGRDALMVALDKRTGEILWQSEPLLDPEAGGAADNAGYASPILVRFADRRLLIGCSQRYLFCVDADTGRIQWTQRRQTSYGVLAMMPVLVGNAVFMSAPFGPPGRLYGFVAPAQRDGKVSVKEIWNTALDPAQGGVVHADGRLYGAYYPRRKGWAALDAATGEILYEEPEFAKGAALFADRRLYALCEDGWMLLLQPTATKFEVQGRFRLGTSLDRDVWAHPVIHEGRLYLRLHDQVFCYDIRAGRTITQGPIDSRKIGK